MQSYFAYTKGCAFTHGNYFHCKNYDIQHTNLAFFSSIIGGFVLCALSPIRVAMSILPVRGRTSPVASSRGRRSIKERSAWSTRLEFYKINSTVQPHNMSTAARYQILLYQQSVITFTMSMLKITPTRLKNCSGCMQHSSEPMPAILVVKS